METCWTAICFSAVLIVRFRTSGTGDDETETRSETSVHCTCIIVRRQVAPMHGLSY